MTVSTGGRVLLRDARVRGDRAVQKVVRKFLKQRSDGRRQEGQRPHDRFAEKDVGSRRPRVRHVRGDRDGDHRDDEPSRDTPRDSCRARRDGSVSDPKTLPLPSHGATEVVELRRDCFVDRLAGASHVLADILAILVDVFADFVARNAVPDGFAALGRPARANTAEARRVTSRPAGATPDASRPAASSAAAPTVRDEA